MCIGITTVGLYCSLLLFWKRVFRVLSEFVVVCNIWYQSQRWRRKIEEVKPDLIGGVAGIINIVEHTMTIHSEIVVPYRLTFSGPQRTTSSVVIANDDEEIEDDFATRRMTDATTYVRQVSREFEAMHKFS